MFSTALTTGTGFPGSRIPITRDPVLGLRSRPPWRTGVGPSRSSFEAFTLFPCYGGFGFTPNPLQPVRSNGLDRIVRCILVRTTGPWYTLPPNINVSLRAPAFRFDGVKSHETGGEPPRPWYERSRRSGSDAWSIRLGGGPRGGARVTAWCPYTNVSSQFSNAGTAGYRSSAGGSPSSFSTPPSSSTVTTPRLFTA